MFPLVINLRVLSSAAPNEDGKLAILFAAGFAMALAALACRPKPLVQLHPAGWLLLLFLALVASAVLWTPNPVDGCVRLAIWISASLCFLAALVGSRDSGTWMEWFHRSSVASALAFSCLFWLDYVRYFLSASRDPWVLFSPIGHVNFTGDVLAIWLPLLLYSAGERSLPRTLRLTAWLCAISLGAVLCLAASRSALGGLGAGALLVCLLLARRIAKTWRSAAAPIATVLTALLLGLLLYLLLPMPFRPIHRLADTLEGRSAPSWPAQDAAAADAVSREPSPPLAGLWSQPWLATRLGPRVPIYAASCAMIADAPLAGHGTGSFRSVYPAYAQRFPGFRDPLGSSGSYATNPHNLVLQIATEDGLPATLLFLLLYAWIALRTVRGALAGRLGAAAAFTAWGVAAGLFGSLFSHTFFNPASLFVMAIASGLLWVQCRTTRTRGATPYKRPARQSQTSRTTGARGTTTLRLGMGIRLGGLTLALALALPALVWLVSQHELGVARAAAPGSARSRDHFARALAWNPRCDRAALGLARHAMLTHQAAQAAQRVEELLRYHPHSAVAYRTLALASMQLGDRDRTRGALKELLRLSPGDRQARNLLERLDAVELNRANRVSSEDPVTR